MPWGRCSSRHSASRARFRFRHALRLGGQLTVGAVEVEALLQQALHLRLLLHQRGHRQRLAFHRATQRAPLQRVGVRQQHLHRARPHLRPLPTARDLGANEGAELRGLVEVAEEVHEPLELLAQPAPGAHQVPDVEEALRNLVARLRGVRERERLHDAVAHEARELRRHVVHRITQRGRELPRGHRRPVEREGVDDALL
jgi:hypothetical protein